MKVELAEILAQVRRIEIRTERLVNALAAGGYRSAFRGQGMEFEDLREYTAGDDARALNWSATARAGRPLVNIWREERELTILLLVDISGSMRFGSIPGISPRSKLALAAEAAAVVGVTALRNRDRVGLLLFSDRNELHLPPRRGRGHALRLVREVLAAPATGRPTDLAGALDHLGAALKRRAVCFVVSDFLGTGDALAASLARAARRHDVIGLRVMDPAEAALPAGGAPLVLADPESGRVATFATGAAARARYAAAWAAERARVQTAFRGAGCDLVDLDTAQGALAAIQRFFRQRRRR